MINIFSKMWALFDRTERMVLVPLFVLMLLGTFLEAFGMGAVIPFIVLLSKPDMVYQNVYFKKVYEFMDPPSLNIFLIWMGIALVLIYVLKNLYLFGLTYIQSRFVGRKFRNLSVELFRSYLHSPYAFHLYRNSAELFRNLEMVFTLVTGVMFRAASVVMETMVLVVIYVCLVAVHPVSSIIIVVVLGGFMGVFQLLVRRQLKSLGKEQYHHWALAYKQVNQGLGSIKETKILGREDFFADEYSNHIKAVARTTHWQRVISEIPRFYIETAIATLVLSVMIVFLLRGDNPQTVLFTLSLFSFAAVRMMPSLVRIGSALANIRFYLPSLDTVYDDMLLCKKLIASEPKTAEPLKVSLSDRIELRNICFTYEKARTEAIKNISFSVNAKTTVGFVGHSGAGKTTIVDIILGLLVPSSGKILVDGTDIRKNIASWREHVSYVPQSIYLIDDTIRANIAFGLAKKDVSDDKIMAAVKAAQLEDFVKILPAGIDTVVGERGARISGGERQRIGIARALYHDPEVLVMDEATSSLDNETEKAFMESVKGLSGKKTIILIAHRLTTIMNCDRIFFFKDGMLAACGTYDELINNSPDFRKMAAIKEF